MENSATNIRDKGTTMPKSFLIITYIVSCAAILVGLIISLHIVYTATGIICYSLFDTIPTAAVIAVLVLALCVFTLVPTQKTAVVKVALRVVSFLEVLSLSGLVCFIAMPLIYSQMELDNSYNEITVTCGGYSFLVCTVLACVNFFFQSREKSLSKLSWWALICGILVFILLAISIF